MLTTIRTGALALATLTLLAAAPAALRAQSIGVDFGDGTPASWLAATDSAGVSPFAQTNFNTLIFPSNTALKDNAGAATTAVLNASNVSGGSIINSTAGTDEVLNSGTLFSRGGTPLTITVTNVPFAAYSLVVYDLATTAGFAQSITAGGASFFTLSPDRLGVGYLDHNAATPFTYTQGTGLSAATATANADYVVFPLLTGSTLTFSALATSSLGRWSDHRLPDHQRRPRAVHLRAGPARRRGTARGRAASAPRPPGVTPRRAVKQTPRASKFAQSARATNRRLGTRRNWTCH